MHSLTTELILPIPLEEAWAFFSNPRNLSRIKPPDMLFKILTELPSGIYPGLIIHYRVAPVYRIPFYWTTEITQSEPLRYFIDEQRSGPFLLWHHEHHFRDNGQGTTLMTDILHYKIGKGIAGWLAGKLFVHAKVKWIFAYRTEKLNRLFLS